MIGIPIDDFDELKSEPVMIKEKDWYREFLDVPNWKCPSCRLTNFGRNKECASCHQKKE